MGRSDRRMANVLGHVLSIAMFPLNPVIAPMFGKQALIFELISNYALVVQVQGRLWTGRLVTYSRDGTLIQSESVPVATSIHTDDRIALYALSRAAEALNDMRGSDWCPVLPESPAERASRQAQAAAKLTELIDALDSVRFRLPAAYRTVQQR